MCSRICRIVFRVKQERLFGELSQTDPSFQDLDSLADRKTLVDLGHRQALQKPLYQKQILPLKAGFQDPLRKVTPRH